MQFIFYISLSDFLMNIGSSFGFPKSGSLLCWMQGIMMQNYFGLCSFFWTTMLSYATYSLINNGRPPFKLWQMKLICCGVPVVLTVLPLSTSIYGAPSPDTQWCIIIPRRSDGEVAALIWSYCAFFGWLILCVVLMMFWSIWSYFKLRSMSNNNTLGLMVRSMYDKVWLYPIGMIFCWTLNFACDENFGAIVDPPLTTAISMILGISYGIVTSLIFIVKSGEARRRWKDVLREIVRSERDDSFVPIDFSEDAIFTSSEVSTSSAFGGPGGRLQTLSKESFRGREMSNSRGVPGIMTTEHDLSEEFLQ